MNKMKDTEILRGGVGWLKNRMRVEMEWTDGDIVPAAVHSIPTSLPPSFALGHRHRMQMQTRNESNGK